MRKDFVLMFRVNKSEDNLIRTNAEQEGIRLSSFLRTAILTYINLRAQNPKLVQKYRVRS